MRDFGSAYRWGVSLLVAALLAWLLVEAAQGQPRFEVEGRGSVMAWAADRHSYQHAMSARADASASWKPVVARAKLGLTRWGTDDAIIEHALLNAETAKVYSRRQGVSLGVRWRGVEVGAEYDRRSVHHVWRNKKSEPRHDHFPSNWRIGRSGEAPDWNRSPLYPSLGYWDGVRPYVRVERGGLRVVVRGPLTPWKDALTLPWPAVRAEGSYRWKKWCFGLEAQGLRHRKPTGTIRIARVLTDPIRVRGSAGWAHPPQWRDVRLWRVAFGLVIKT